MNRNSVSNTIGVHAGEMITEDLSCVATLGRVGHLRSWLSRVVAKDSRPLRYGPVVVGWRKGGVHTPMVDLHPWPRALVSRIGVKNPFRPLVCRRLNLTS